MPRRLILPAFLTFLFAVTVEGWYRIFGAWTLLGAVLFAAWVACRMLTGEENGRG